MMLFAILPMALALHSGGSIPSIRRRATDGPHLRAAPALLSAEPSPPSPKLIIADSAAVALYSLQLSACKSLALAFSDMTSPGFDLAADVAAFDPVATSTYLGVEQFAAASLVAGWIAGGLLSGACGDRWTELGRGRQLKTLLSGWAIAVPLALALKYGVLSHVDLPSLGQSEQAVARQAELSSLTLPNALADGFGMLGALALWRQILLRNPWLML